MPSKNLKKACPKLGRIAVYAIFSSPGKLLCICVPRREKWKEFGWCGKSVEDIMTLLAKEDIPKYHPGDPGFVSSTASTVGEERKSESGKTCGTGEPGPFTAEEQDNEV